MKILITGITGYIGSHIARKCIEEGNVVAGLMRKDSDLTKYGVDRAGIEFGIYDGTILSLAAYMEKIKPDVVIHCAAMFAAEHETGQVDDLLRSNIIFSAHIFEAMKRCGVKQIINTTSSWEHYHNEDYNPVCLYAATKKAAEDILKYYVDAEEFRAITLMIYDTYGGDDKRGKILSLFKKIAESGEDLCMSGGEQQINLVHIEDVVNAYITALGLLQYVSGEEKVYQIRSDEILTLKQAAELYERVNRVKLPIQWGTRGYRKREVMQVYPYGEVLPGWKSAISLAEGMTELGYAKRQRRI